MRWGSFRTRTLPSHCDACPEFDAGVRSVALERLSMVQQRDAEKGEEERRWECMVVLAPLRLPRGTGSLFNPIAVF